MLSHGSPTAHGSLEQRQKRMSDDHTTTLDDPIAPSMDEREPRGVWRQQSRSLRFHQGAISQSAQRALTSFVLNWIANGNQSVRMDNRCHHFFWFSEGDMGSRITRLYFTPAS